MDGGADSYHRFLAGDENALIEIVEQHNRNLIFFINRYVANLTVAEDLAADTFLELIEKKPKINRGASFKTYLYQIGRNNALDFLRRQVRHPGIPLDELELADLNGLEDEIIRSEQQREIYTALRQLRPEYYDVLYLLYFADMTYDQAATVLKKNRKQINNLTYRAKIALKAVLEKEISGDEIHA
ncbi:MAG TPA: RNA polymerase subunit sigma-24 [Clostridiales bacterium]|nr:RNA polymerase subunit sigma-24 [Clostridiales bacterium]